MVHPEFSEGRLVPQLVWIIPIDPDKRRRASQENFFRHLVGNPAVRRKLEHRLRLDGGSQGQPRHGCPACIRPRESNLCVAKCCDEFRERLAKHVQLQEAAEFGLEPVRPEILEIIVDDISSCVFVAASIEVGRPLRCQVPRDQLPVVATPKDLRDPIARAEGFIEEFLALAALLESLDKEASAQEVADGIAAEAFEERPLAMLDVCGGAMRESEGRVDSPTPRRPSLG